MEIMRLRAAKHHQLMRFMKSATDLRDQAFFIQILSDGKYPFSRVSAAQIDLSGFAQAFDPSFPQS